MDGTHVGWDAMNNCTDQEYWDTLVYQCIPCSLVCSRPTVRRCAALCESMDCNRRAGSYYDELLKKCINCTTVCGQHPKQCAPSCESKAVWEASAGTCHRREDSSKDRLVEAGSVGDGSTGSKVPEPVETCGFCFPGHSSAVRETKPCHSSSCHIGERAAPSHTGICSTGSAGAIPSPEDGHFKIICSPSQEKTPMV
ncbi:PREDICTED: tumor necrosis factor receptor superfamily member 13B [Tauraco erythrolophus]|uniref:tumor necrosis factor receptor superfamily member 13B n=1 Tax=Tauraco erythrolophus TaxID=121530 RepID=UPI0005234831|nr:PREDICTED: tumor necrosis factor receptor superfamily member 13B [Tauraco erythrolophus]